MDHVKNSVNCWKAKGYKAHANQQPSPKNSIKVFGKVQRLDDEKLNNKRHQRGKVSKETYDIVRSSWKQERLLEQPLPPNGVCNLGSLDLSKFITKNREGVNFAQLELATKLAIRFLDSVTDKSGYPTKDIEKWVKENRAVGASLMGFADYCLLREIAYGSDESSTELENILKFVYDIAKNESEKLGQEKGIPLMCQKLPEPRRNITLLTEAPAGTLSLLGGCSSGIEPIFSEIVIRNDKTGTYTFENDLASKDYFRCAVSANGAVEVTWEEHIKILASAQKHVDSGVSKTINFPARTHRDTIGKAVMLAWKSDCKGVAVYRNGSRKQEVLSPKNIKKDKCPVCGEETIKIAEQTKCTKCDWIMKETTENAN